MKETPSTRWGLRGDALLLFLVVPAVGAAVAVMLSRWAAGSDSAVAEFLTDKGAHKIMRRAMMLCVLCMVPGFLRRAGWSGWRDTGWAAEAGRVADPRCRRHVGWGLVIGLPTMGLLVMGARWADLRTWLPGPDQVALAPELIGLLAAAVLIAVFEETAVRGILFRVLGRRWGNWQAAVATSVLFSWLHFFKASRPAVEAAGSWTGEWMALITTSWMSPLHIESFGLRFLNLSLMGLVLCVVVMRTQTIWLAVGLHAAWAWIKQAHDAVADRTEGAIDPGLWGFRSDMTDGPMTTLMLATLLVLFSTLYPSRADTPDDTAA